MFHHAAFDRRSKVNRGLERSLNRLLQSGADKRRGLFQKFMKPALLADAKVWPHLPCLQVQTELLLFKSKFRIVCQK